MVSSFWFHPFQVAESATSATCPCTINLGWCIVYIEGSMVIFPSDIVYLSLRRIFKKIVSSRINKAQSSNQGQQNQWFLCCLRVTYPGQRSVKGYIKFSNWEYCLKKRNLSQLILRFVWKTVCTCSILVLFNSLPSEKFFMCISRLLIINFFEKLFQEYHQQAILMKYHALFVIFERKKSKFCYCRLLQIIGDFGLSKTSWIKN